jgi:hypothetical protein
MRKSLIVGGKLSHMHCCAHITNLMVQDSLGEISVIIDCTREGSKYLVALEGRLRKFAEMTKNLQLSSNKFVFGCTYLLE